MTDNKMPSERDLTDVRLELACNQKPTITVEREVLERLLFAAKAAVSFEAFLVEHGDRLTESVLGTAHDWIKKGNTRQSDRYDETLIALNHLRTTVPKKKDPEPMPLLHPDDRYPWEAEDGSVLNHNPDFCRGCGLTILPENRRIADGCACNNPRGINHGLVPKNTCTCPVCDPAQTGSTRIVAPIGTTRITPNGPRPHA